MDRKRIGLIGSGKRMQEHFMPALRCLEDHLEVVGVHSKTAEHANAFGKRWDLPSFDSLHQLSKAADALVLSVSVGAVPEVLARLAPEAQRLILVADTPVVPNVRSIASLRDLARFARVVVTEDYMNFPQFELARSIAASGLVGHVQRVELLHSGYRYHGLAVIRSFFDLAAARRVTRRRAANDACSLEFDFGAGRGGVIEEPYLRQAGSYRVVGSNGVIAGGTHGPSNGRVTLVRDIMHQGEWVGVRAEAGSDVFELRPPEAPALAVRHPGVSAFDRQKTCGLVRVLRSLFENNINNRYSYVDGTYDHFLTLYARRTPVFVDPVAYLGGHSLSFVDWCSRRFDYP